VWLFDYFYTLTDYFSDLQSLNAPITGYRYPHSSYVGPHDNPYCHSPSIKASPTSSHWLPVSRCSHTRRDAIADWRAMCIWVIKNVQTSTNRRRERIDSAAATQNRTTHRRPCRSRWWILTYNTLLSLSLSLFAYLCVSYRPQHIIL